MTASSPLRLVQRRGLRVREFELHDDRVEVAERLPLAATEARVALNRISDEPVQVATRSRLLLAAALLATAVGTGLAWRPIPGVGGLALVAAGAVSAALWLLFLRGWRRQLVYPAAEVDLNFFADPSHRAELDPFLETLFERRRQLLGGETERPEEGPADDLERWSWLHEQGYLTDEELGLLEERLGASGSESSEIVH